MKDSMNTAALQWARWVLKYKYSWTPFYIMLFNAIAFSIVALLKVPGSPEFLGYVAVLMWCGVLHHFERIGMVAAKEKWDENKPV